ncbi:glycosyltransferase [Tundrisphaera lichenicola]|uniref:glycosyltransferase n=1 Tax=Tundrisphaera lichenicola TaxID=2029860 RepID=UPI003EB9BD7A
MSHPREPVAVVLARTHPTPDLEASLARFAEEVGPMGEILLVDSSGGDLPELAPNVRLIRGIRGRLAPELWRDGLLASKAPLVAFSTVQMIPRRGWLASLMERLVSTGAAGVGGPIEPGPDLSATDRAVALLRYSGYFPPLPDPSTIEPPGENALYRRDRLEQVGSSWLDGFWEAEVHRSLRDRGETLAMADGAIAHFFGGVGPGSMARQRWSHARRYGADRSKSMDGLSRLLRIAACPMVPPVLTARSISRLRIRGMRLVPWISSIPILAALSTAWAMGEAVGICRFGTGETPANPGHAPAGPLAEVGSDGSAIQHTRRAG